MDVAALRARLKADIAAGDRPLMLVGTAGTVATGAVDPLRELAAVAREHGIWFHVDGAYGAPAAALPDAPEDLRALALADSLAVDPHKWLYAPLEAGCVLVREADRLAQAFSYTPTYYHFETEGDEPPINYYELGPAELARLPRVEGMAGSPPGGPGRIRPHDRATTADSPACCTRRHKPIPRSRRSRSASVSPPSATYRRTWSRARPRWMPTWTP